MRTWDERNLAWLIVWLLKKSHVSCDFYIYFRLKVFNYVLELILSFNNMNEKSSVNTGG